MPLVAMSDGCRVHYDIMGRGAPVVLIPGLGGDGRFWEPVAERLVHGFMLIVVDHRGAGRSDRPLGPYSIERIAADVLEIMNAEEVHRAHLVGHSTGGAIVQTLALDAAERADRIVISGSWARPDARFRMLFQARLALLEANQPEIYQAFTHVLGYSAEWLASHEHGLDGAVERARAALAPLDVTAARLRMLLAFDRAGEIGRIAAPTLVLGALDDEMVPYAHSLRIAEAIPSALLDSMAGGHFFPRTDPHRFAELVRGFLVG
ncbi:alpha/beta hydrolase [Ancylobacter sp. 6x-1]|uniref:Alpha/beta hydrolase n=1 Tax=Ancylobacter crimeensis TaxID=2579147 RepID=A0ABT0D9X9_9HYPH|nr:alpha/beta hydrolase [Ancylobacter crimeensis]MCK0196719.1 alpha/beta hydrolase [Ancylobacter crimeensis]